MFRRLRFILCGAMLAIAAVPSLAHAAPSDLTITAPASDGEDQTPLIQGTADPGLVLEVLIDSVEVATVTVTPEGTWEFQVVDSIAPGTGVTIEAVTRDDSGHVVGSTAHSYYVWEEPSSIEITVPADGDPINGYFGVIAQVTNPGQMTQDFTLLLDGNEIPTRQAFMDSLRGELTIRVEEADLPEGVHELTVTGTDTHGRSATSGPISVVVDMTPPSKPVVTSHRDGDVITDRTPTFSGTADPGTSVELEFHGSGEPVCDDVTDAAGHWSCEPTGRAAEWLDDMDGQRDEVTIVVVSRDPAGNVGVSQLRVIVDFRKGGGSTGTPTAKPTPTTSSPKPTTRPTPSPTATAPTATAAPLTSGPTPDLANTGASPTGPLLVAGALLVVGVGLRRFSRPRG